VCAVQCIFASVAVNVPSPNLEQIRCISVDPIPARQLLRKRSAAMEPMAGPGGRGPSETLFFSRFKLTRLAVFPFVARQTDCSWCYVRMARCSLVFGGSSVSKANMGYVVYNSTAQYARMYYEYAPTRRNT
jgi:hypothetical protein